MIPVARTKTIATVGPSCQTQQMLCALLRAGVNVFRLNMAHGTRQTHEQVLEEIRSAAQSTGLSAAVLVDLAGPKIRLHELPGDLLELAPGDRVDFLRQPGGCEEGRKGMTLSCTYPQLVDDVPVGNSLLLGDGLVRLEVGEKLADRLRCRVEVGGIIRSRQGVHMPGVMLSVSALGEKDRRNAVWAIEQEADFISLSFVQRASEIEQLRQLIAQHGGAAQTVAKIEKRRALDDLEAIVRVADAVMVARGDLGLEIEIEKTPLAQKRIIRLCQQLGKPVIVATQMLESMHHSRQPTRAEVSDVANAILDGADACMLSGETAIGDYPTEAVAMMRRIMLETEQLLADRPSRLMAREEIERQGVSEAVIFGAAQVARRIRAKLVVITTATGQTTLAKSKQRDFIPTLGVSDRPEIIRRMCLYWGVIPVFFPSINDLDQVRQFVNEWARTTGHLQAGDYVVCVIDTPALAELHETVTVVRIGG